MKKAFVFLALFAGGTAFAQTPAQIIGKFYPEFNQKNQCYAVVSKERGSYCVKQVKAETRETGQGRLMYVLFAGNKFDFKENIANGAHADSGLAGVFVFKQKANGWQLLAAAPQVTVGASGDAPEKFTFHEFGKDKWGFLTRHSDVHQGFSGSHYVILAHDGGSRISQSWIGANADNSGAYGSDCEVVRDGGGTRKEIQACLVRLYSLDATVRILRNRPMSGGFYPLQLTVTGNEGKKTYRGQTFVIPFDVKKGKYVAPKPYPLNNKTY